MATPPPPGDFPAVLVTGITAIHGWPIYERLRSLWPASRLLGVQPPRGVITADERVVSLCLTDREGLSTLAASFDPDVVLHAGGVCDLDVCEARPRWAHRINVEGTRTLLELFPRARFIACSSDLVFSGKSPPPGGYREEHSVDPVSVVGKTYSRAEELVRSRSGSTVLRVALPLGPSVQGSKGAHDWIRGRLVKGLPVTLFRDEVRSLIGCGEVARILLACVRRPLPGLYHLGGPRGWSLHEIGRTIVERGGFDPGLLRAAWRAEEVGGPPRIGDVSLASSRLEAALATRIAPAGGEFEGELPARPVGPAAR